MHDILFVNCHHKVRAKFLARQLQSCFYLSTRNRIWLQDFGLEIIQSRLYNMTSQEKAINLRYIFITFKPKIYIKTHQYIHLFILHVMVFFNLFRRVFLTPIHVPFQRAPIMGFVDVHWVNCHIWVWNKSKLGSILRS